MQYFGRRFLFRMHSPTEGVCGPARTIGATCFLGPRSYDPRNQATSHNVPPSSTPLLRGESWPNPITIASCQLRNLSQALRKSNVDSCLVIWSMRLPPAFSPILGNEITDRWRTVRRRCSFSSRAFCLVIYYFHSRPVHEYNNQTIYRGKKKEVHDMKIYLRVL